MSLTRQLKTSGTPVAQFFAEWGDRKGIAALIPSLRDLRKFPGFGTYTPPESWVWSVLGVTTDYLLKAREGPEVLDAENSVPAVAPRGLFPLAPLRGWFHGKGDYLGEDFLKELFAYGRSLLEAGWGRAFWALKGPEENNLPTYGATAFAVLDALYRSGRLPKGLWEEWDAWDFYEHRFTGSVEAGSHEKCEHVIKFYISRQLTSKYSLPQWNEALTEILSVYDEARKRGGLKGITFRPGAGTLSNDRLVGGADFDRLVEKPDGRVALVDFKTKKKRIEPFEIQQLLGYALLYRPSVDGPPLDDLGIYYPLTGKYREISLSGAIRKAFPGLGDYEDAQAAFLATLPDPKNLVFPQGPDNG